ncbi:851_t:CDS:1 [Paraglomus occultum]|uniref:851_t:CDS:1 n=1 Tax=Paraglomus occultum TaxID=144539 RepID=A0A9N9B8P3_9GLOM|nr:851_t:CDS:1 [Paraglomus occultum]
MVLINQDILAEITTYLDDDPSTLHSLMLTSRTFCRIAVPLAYKNPFRFISTAHLDRKHSLICTYLTCLSASEKKYFIKTVKIIKDSKPMFNYASYLEQLDCLVVYGILATSRMPCYQWRRLEKMFRILFGLLIAGSKRLKGLNFVGHYLMNSTIQVEPPRGLRSIKIRSPRAHNEWIHSLIAHQNNLINFEIWYADDEILNILGCLATQRSSLRRISFVHCTFIPCDQFRILLNDLERLKEVQFKVFPFDSRRFQDLMIVLRESMEIRESTTDRVEFIPRGNGEREMTVVVEKMSAWSSSD